MKIMDAFVEITKTFRLCRKDKHDADIERLKISMFKESLESVLDCNGDVKVDLDKMKIEINKTDTKRKKQK